MIPSELTPDELRAASEAPDGLAPPAMALWWAARGDWDAAHKLVQDAEGRDAAWVHAYLHRVEGDDVNAQYWYWQAGRQPSTDTLESEWTSIARELLGRESA